MKTAEMHFVPIPTTREALDKTIHLWMPFVGEVPKHNGESLQTLIDQVLSGRVQVGLAWDGKRAHALVGLTVWPREEGALGEIRWLVGGGMREWESLWDEGRRTVVRVPGTCVVECLAYVRHDYDDVDRIYIDHETIGGG